MKAIFLVSYLLFATLAMGETKQFVIHPSDHLTMDGGCGYNKYVVLPENVGVMRIDGCSGYYTPARWGRYLNVYVDFNNIHSFAYGNSVNLMMEFSSDRECDAFWSRFLGSSDATVNMDIAKKTIQILLPR